MKNKKKIFLWGLVLVVIILLALPKIQWGEKTAQTNQNTKPVIVDALVMQPRQLDNVIVVNASIMGDEEVELRSEASGKVISINFEEGRRVKKGDLLVKINDADLQAQLKRAESQLKLAEEREYRMSQLLEKDFVSREEYDVVANELASRSAEIDLLKAQIEKTEIIAPFDGIVGLRWISEGSVISSSVSIATLTKINPVKINFAVPQKYYGNIKIGTEIIVKIPSSDKSYNAEVYAIEPKIDRATRSLQVRAIADNKNGELVPGAYVEIEVVVDRDDTAFQIPTIALVPDLQGEKVFLYKDGKAVEQKVQTGIRTDTHVQITEGVNQGDTVITSAIIQLRPNINVQIENLESM